MLTHRSCLWLQKSVSLVRDVKELEAVLEGELEQGLEGEDWKEAGNKQI